MRHLLAFPLPPTHLPMCTCPYMRCFPLSELCKVLFVLEELRTLRFTSLMFNHNWLLFKRYILFAFYYLVCVWNLQLRKYRTAPPVVCCFMLMNNSAFSLYLYTGITVVYKVEFEFAQFERAIVETGQFITVSLYKIIT